MFTQAFLQFLIVAALIWTALGTLTLLALLLRDRKNGTLW